MTELNKEYLVILDMMTIAFVEIRASKDLRTCQALADAFHNAPSRIAAGRDAEYILKSIMDASERTGLREYLEKLYEHSKKNIASRDESR